MDRGPSHNGGLSPFDIYDIIFVKELVNNLNKDNETLNATIDDLKNAFLFLYEKHKALKKSYIKECMNRSVIENQNLRIEDLQS